MPKPLVSPSQLRLLLIPGEATPPSKPPKGRGGASAGPTLLPLSLPYPSTPDVMVDFFVSGQSIYEINKSCRSVGTCSALLPPELVLSDASLLLATPVDPLLLLLPHLKQHASKSFVPLLDAVAPTQLELQVRRNLQAVSQHPGVLRRLDFTCDIRLLNATKDETEKDTEASCPSAAATASHASAAAAAATAATPAVSAEEGKRRRAAAEEGTLFVRFNLDKTLTFLLQKHAKLAAAIAAQRGISCSSSSSSGNSNLAASPADCSSNALSFSLLSAYLTPPIATALEQRLKKDGILLITRPGGAEKICMQKTGEGSSSAAAAAAAAAAATAATKATNSSKTGTRLKRAAATAASTNTKKTQVKKKAP
ncbi:uncharacterized protein EMH_0041350 [Eimeria mitis]|uniref:Uncharacterized protein n=1 Tax=Eimeria mitis TaxID=44415 RepID=U6KIW3_9EIME|nr:uncharacterized protein EMH_0041350 [Eimeria mitis]CDJ36222.1 hypothetical protein, conserved [Eimeria mitis]